MALGEPPPADVVHPEGRNRHAAAIDERRRTAVRYRVYVTLLDTFGVGTSSAALGLVLLLAVAALMVAGSVERLIDPAPIRYREAMLVAVFGLAVNLVSARILGAVGEVVWVDDETLLDPVTAVSASGPAYVFWFIEQLALGGEKLGLAPEVARKLALQTVLGSARLAAQSGEAPGVLRAQVTSKGGTTEAALRVFAEERLAERLLRALEAANRRAAELGEELGREP